MIKKLFVLNVLFALTAQSSFCLQLQESQIQKINSSGGSNTTKIYDAHGSYQYKLVQKPNGQTRRYGKTGSFEGYYKTQGNKVKFYTK